MSSIGVRAIFLLVITVLSGCVSQRYLPDEGLNRSGGAIPVTVSPGEMSNDFILVIGDQRSFRASNRQLAARALTDWSARPDPLLPDVTLNLETSGEGIRGASFFSIIPYLATFGIFPMISYAEYEHVLTMEKNGRELYRHSNKGILREQMAFWPILPYFFGTSQNRATAEMMHDVLADHRTRLSSFIAAHEQAWEHQVGGKPADEVRRWLRDNPNALFRKRALARLADMAPERELAAVDWHREHSRSFPGYDQHIPASLRVWFIGPRGETVADILDQVRSGEDLEILAARIRSGGPYKRFSHEEDRRLRDAGLPATLVAAMMEASAPAARTPHSTVSSSSAQGRHVSELVRHDNAGRYMSPWTSDGVLAEWVNMTIDTQVGEAAGGAVGAVAGAAAGRRALRNVPGGGFLGGMVGAQAGKATGREIALQAAGGMDHVRATSDMSFDSLEDMARYLRAMHGNDPNFNDAINAANRIYPGLKDAL